MPFSAYSTRNLHSFLAAPVQIAALPICTGVEFAPGTATSDRNQGGSPARMRPTSRSESQRHWSLFQEKEGIEEQRIKQNNVITLEPERR